MELKEKLCYYYKLYNLNIKSDFYLSELSHSTFDTLSNIDINIISGKCPIEIKNIKAANSYYTISENEAMFTAAECGKFYITNGDTIIIELIENPNYEHLKSYLLSRAFAILLFQRNTVALHGSSIIFDDKAYVFCGQSGAGKSSLSAALTLQGYKMLSDDLSVLKFEGDKPYIEPGFAQHKLCTDTMEYFNLSSHNLTKVDNFANKYALPTSHNFINTAHPVTILVELNIDYTNTKSTVSFTEVFGNEKLQTIFRNTFRPQLMTDIGLNPKYLKQCLNCAKNIRVFKLTRPKNIFTLKEQIALIKKIQN